MGVCGAAGDVDERGDDLGDLVGGGEWAVVVRVQVDLGEEELVQRLASALEAPVAAMAPHHALEVVVVGAFADSTGPAVIVETATRAVPMGPHRRIEEAAS